MKILYLGTVCDLIEYEKKTARCKTKPSVAPMVFETALLQGFAENGLQAELLSYPMIPLFFRGGAVSFGGCTETVSGYPCYWLRTINLPFLKQWSRRFDASRIIKKWAKENKGDGVIFSYSIPPFLVKDILKYARRYHLKTVALIPDLLENMYINHKGNFMINAMRQRYLNKALKLQGEYDGYVYLTEAMRDVVAPNKPYIVMEGILDAKDLSADSIAKASPRAIMYAGRLHEKYGIMNLVEAFQQLPALEAELWLFGDGTAVDEIKQCCKSDRRIQYFGRTDREIILEYERRATLLINPRSTKEKFTKYSFPSKTIEYMASGTPLLTTRLEGIPSEYYDYVFHIGDNDIGQIKTALERIFLLSDDELSEKGSRAKRFAAEQKNAKTQSARIIKFIENLVGGNQNAENP